MIKPFASDDKLISIQRECVACTTYASTTLRILGGSADYSTPELLIDEKFRVYTIIGERRCNKVAGWWNRLKWTLTPIYHVDLIFAEPSRQSTLEECRNLIYQAMELDPDLYESSWSMERWKELLWSAATFEELYLLKQGGESYRRFEVLRDAREKEMGANDKREH